jgi:hypothetical protein
MEPLSIRRACSSRRSNSLRSLFSVIALSPLVYDGKAQEGLDFRLAIVPCYLAVALPEFNIVAVNKLFRLFHSIVIVSAVEWDRVGKVPVRIDDISAVIRQMALPCFWRERDTLSHRMLPRADR